MIVVDFYGIHMTPLLWPNHHKTQPNLLYKSLLKSNTHPINKTKTHFFHSNHHCHSAAYPIK